MKNINSKIRRSVTVLTRIARKIRYGSPQTKVFCVGFQKTGTTSLGYALHLLGYRVAGSTQIDRSPPYDRLAERAMSMTVYFDAFQDMPWALFYKEFDKAYPKAKFILTLRDPDAWHRSMTKHFPDDLSRLGKVVYGTTRADEKDLLVERYSSHVSEVRRYFADKPGKLLEIDLSDCEGWDEICGFLDTKHPKRPFPKLNTASMRA